MLGDIMGSATGHTQRGLSAEQISALLDSELEESQADALLGGMDGAQARQLWREYHLIGDALRSDELVGAHPESAFLASFSARFVSEPHLLAPAALAVQATGQSGGRHAAHAAGGKRNPFLMMRKALPTAAAAAAVAALSWVVVPRIQENNAGPVAVVAQNTAPSAVQHVAATTPPVAAATAKNGDLIVVRDARLDQYLEAHQQYAPYLVGQGVSPYVRASAQADE